MSLEISGSWAEQPAGMQDVYPKQAKRRREIENRLLSMFEDQGYDMVSSGTFEYVDTLLRGRESREAEDWLRLIDATGKTVALRPDMTPSIARMAAPLVKRGVRELRWTYAERVYRRSSDPASLSWSGGKAAESTQVGVEWIGAVGHDADANLLLLCQISADRLGLHDWQMVASHARFSSGLLRLFGLSEAATGELIAALVRGDYVGFRKLQIGFGVEEDLLNVLGQLDPMRPRALPETVVNRWQEHADGAMVRQLWNDLVMFARVLQQRGIAERMSFDFTLARDLTYYTGLIFEVFVPGVGAPIALGGRYDDLLAQFGAAAPAIGFTFEVERLLAALTAGGWLDRGEDA